MVVRFMVVVLLSLSIKAQDAGAEGYPAAEGFDLAGSDAKAIEIADRVMEKMGGWENWNQTRYITWRFFGRRLHVWDKWTGNLRHEDRNRLILMNVHNKKGRVWHDGFEETHVDSVKKYVNQGYRRWINDSYWLVMPYKLKDSGVTLTYEGEDGTLDNRPAHKLTLTFKDVGVTPQNKYHVWVDKAQMLVTEWAYYSKASDTEPRFRSPWTNWTKYGKIWLSDGRGSNRTGERKHSDIAVFDTLPASVFESPEKVDMMEIQSKY